MDITSPPKTVCVVLEFKRRIPLFTVAVVASEADPQTVSHYIMTPRGIVTLEHRAPARYVAWNGSAA